MVGVDYVDQKITLPLQWLVIVACMLERPDVQKHIEAALAAWEASNLPVTREAARRAARLNS